MHHPVQRAPVTRNLFTTPVNRGGIQPSSCVDCAPAVAHALGQLCTPGCCDCLPARLAAVCHQVCG